MRYRVESNVTGEALSRWFDDWKAAVYACAALNSSPGAGGYAGIYDEDGVRRHEPAQ